jgi:hypothetical protein
VRAQGVMHAVKRFLEAKERYAASRGRNRR